MRERKILTKYRIGSVLSVIAVLLVAESSWAHHSFSAVFDISKEITLTGTLTKLDWRNPHIAVFVEAKDNQGQPEAWVVETMPPNFFRARNITKSDFEKAIGQPVIVEAVRARDGSLYGLMQQITFPDGRSVRMPELQLFGDSDTPNGP